MPSHVFADHTAAQPPERGAVDALISQARRLRGEVDAMRRETAPDGGDPAGRWQRALCDLAVHQLNDLDAHLAQLRDGPPCVVGEPAAPAGTAERDPRRGSLLSRVGSAEWDLLTDEATWSGELYEILGRDTAAPPLSLDELPSLVHAEDQPRLTAMVTDCLVDGKPIDGEFRVLRPGGGVRQVHMMGEPVLAPDGSTASMWAVLRDVSELRRSRVAVHESQDSLRRPRHGAETDPRLAAALQEAVLPPWRDTLRFTAGGLDLAADHLPSSTGAPIGGDWHDALQLPDGDALLSVGDLTGPGVTGASGMAMLLGALRGTAVTGAGPAHLLGWLNQLMEATARPATGSAVCCRYDPAAHRLTWAQAGHPAPLLFREGAGRALTPPVGAPLGSPSKASYAQADVQLRPGDLLLLRTDGLVPRCDRDAATTELLSMAPRFTGALNAQDCVRAVMEAFDEVPREADACLLMARV
ncbi:PP2C family protein-serine/threonine phosphatase [Streptomyces alfalfae]|uniref:SpoIIE family protein phosphatase n=1 Tax=Streptomyces alfalfae TaxID=1642299 RepID=A0A7T4U120_9ACTN|nr:SpoIIE family protein phosphatase [Streptomyces alfalfae]QQC92925.1 SpoIIE family protein phosphatase [Streptomyces alfalfae]